MKRTQKNVVLSLALLLMLGVALAREFLVQDRFEGDVAQETDPLLEGYDLSRVVTLRVIGPGEQDVELKKVARGWVLVAGAVEYRADEDAVIRALEVLGELKQGKVVTRQTSNLERYHLSGSRAIRVVGSDLSGRALVELTLGKNSGDGRSSYVRLKGAEKAVRRVRKGAVRNHFDKTPEYLTWRDKTILDEGAPEDVLRITVRGPDHVAVLERAPGPEGKKGWVLSQPVRGAAKDWTADSMAETLSSLDCDVFHTGTETAAELGVDSSNPTWTLEAERVDGSKTVLLMGEKDEDSGRYPVRVPDDPTIFWIAQYRGAHFVSEPEAFLQEPPDESGDGGGK